MTMKAFSGVVRLCRRQLPVFTFLLAMAFAVAASAQLAGKGEIRGTVTDAQGAAVPGAQIVATKVSTGVATKTTSTSSGDYSLPSLDPGEYTLTFVAPSFQKLTQEHVQVNALETASLNPKLTVGAATETITVTAQPPQLETTNATLGATLENEMYSALPIEMGAYGQPDQRRATDFAFLMPGVQGNNTSGNATTNTGIVNGSGSRGAVSTVYVDGTPFVRAGGNGDPRYVWTAISVDAVDQFQVQTSGYSAIYEGQGIQNYTIKAGGNHYHGSIYEFFRNTALDTWGWLGSVPNPVTGKPSKPVEHNNEYGINLSGPLVPFGKWRDRLFAFANYNGFRYASQTPTQITFPTAAQQSGDFSGFTDANGNVIPIYDPLTQATCTAHNGGQPCRYQFGYGPGAATTFNYNNPGNAILTGTPNVIPANRISPISAALQSYLPSGIGTALQNNYISPNRTGLVNWSTTERIDFNISSKNQLTLVAAIGRQASSNPVGQTTAGRNVGPIPYNYGQTYAPKTAVGVIEDTYTFSPNLVNQFKYGYARYNGPTFDADQLPAYAASAQGISGLPAGAASGAFPITTFNGTNPPTQWAGTGPGVTLAENYTLLDNVQWTKGKHSFTFGGQIAWLLYNVVNATGGSTPITIANSTSETSGLAQPSTCKSSGTTCTATPSYSSSSGTGAAYASFLLGAYDKVSFTQYGVQENGTRFRSISGYVQDNWKVSPKLTLDLGVRYDFFPSLTEVHDAMSYFDPNLANPVTGTNGGLQFTGHGAGTCNCDTPVHNFYRHIGPRLGAAYSVDDKTVLRASWGIMFTHGNAVGGSSTSLGSLGYSAAPSTGPNGSLTATNVIFNGTFPTYAPPAGSSVGAAYGTGYTTTSGYTSSPSGIGYADPYMGGRAPEYVNYTFGLQHQWGQNFTSTMTYVGSQGHFLPTDGGNARGYWSDQLDPKYLSLGSNLNLAGSQLQAFCANAANAGVCPSNYALLTSTQTLAQLLKPFPFNSVSDSFGYVANSVYNSLQVQLNMRPQHGLSFMANYTWGRAIDDGGTFRTGYAIPAGLVANSTRGYSMDAIERSVSTTNQPHHVVITGVWDMPFGRQVFAEHAWQRAIFGGFKFSEIFQAYSGSPLAVTASSCPTNPAQSTCLPILNPAWGSNTDPRINGHWGSKSIASQTTATTYITPSVNADTTGKTCQPTGPFIVPTSVCLSQYNYQFSNSPRTAPYGLTGPGNYQLDIALVRSFPLHFTDAARLNFRAEMYNVTNHTFFAVASTQLGNAAFGTVTTNSAYNRRAVQLSARVDF